MTIYSPELLKLLRRDRTETPRYMWVLIALAILMVGIGMLLGEPR